MRKFYRHVIQVEVLSEYKIAMENMDLDNIHQIITDGDCSGMVEVKIANQVVSEKEMAELLEKQGSDPGFFNLDKDGKSTEEE
jgi:hypothetical protein